MGESMGKTCAQMAINWVISQPQLTTALLGVKNEKQMEENVKALDWKLDLDQQERINHIFAIN